MNYGCFFYICSMKASSISELKKELQTLSPSRVLELCMCLTKYKKDNKELLSYLLFDAQDEEGYIQEVKEMIRGQFDTMNRSTTYMATKTIRKILRNTNKYIKYSGNRQTETELRIYFCISLRQCGVIFHTSIAISNIFQRQLIKINSAIASMHEDLQHDYREILKSEGLDKD